MEDLSYESVYTELQNKKMELETKTKHFGPIASSKAKHDLAVLNLLMTACEKQIAKEPATKTYLVGLPSSDTSRYKACPTCGEMMFTGSQKYPFCWRCGQKIRTDRPMEEEE